MFSQTTEAENGGISWIACVDRPSEADGPTEAKISEENGEITSHSDSSNVKSESKDDVPSERRPRCPSLGTALSAIPPPDYSPPHSPPPTPTPKEPPINGDVAFIPNGHIHKTPNGDISKTPDGDTSKTPDGDTSKTPDGDIPKTVHEDIRGIPSGDVSKTPKSEASDTPKSTGSAHFLTVELLQEHLKRRKINDSPERSMNKLIEEALRQLIATLASKSGLQIFVFL